MEDAILILMADMKDDADAMPMGNAIVEMVTSTECVIAPQVDSDA